MLARLAEIPTPRQAFSPSAFCLPALLRHLTQWLVTISTDNYSDLGTGTVGSVVDPETNNFRQMDHSWPEGSGTARNARNLSATCFFLGR